MDPFSLAGALVAASIGPFFMGWLERRQFRKGRKPEEIADEVATVAAQEVEALASEPVTSSTSSLQRPKPPSSPPTRSSRRRTPHPSEPGREDEDLQVQELGEKLAKSPQFRKALGIQDKTTLVWVVQILVSLGLVAVSVWSFASDTETGVGFAFCGSLAGFWMREITG